MKQTYSVLIRKLTQLGYLKNPHNIEAFYHTPRSDFFSPAYYPRVHHDEPITEQGKVVSPQPLVVAHIIELIHPQAGEVILEDGVGYGWQTALLAHSVRYAQEESTGVSIVVVDSEKSHLQKAQENLERHNLISDGTVQLHKSNSIKKHSHKGSYDKIVSMYHHHDTLPEEWKGLLNIGGIAVFPSNDAIVWYKKTDKNTFERKQFHGFPSLIRSRENV